MMWVVLIRFLIQKVAVSSNCVVLDVVAVVTSHVGISLETLSILKDSDDGV
jgi:hypothetical protein